MDGDKRLKSHCESKGFGSNTILAAIINLPA
jgi:hypothetical protein